MDSIWKCLMAAPHSILFIVSLFARNVDMLSMIQAAYSSICAMGAVSLKPAKHCLAADSETDSSFMNWIA